MGCVASIAADRWPKQGAHLGKRVVVIFHHDTSRAFEGTVVRDDVEEPFITIIALDDGRQVLATECQYSLQKPDFQRAAAAPGTSAQSDPAPGPRHPSQSVTGTCLECGRPLDARRRARGNRRYCSGRCRVQAWRRRKEELRSADPKAAQNSHSFGPDQNCE